MKKIKQTEKDFYRKNRKEKRCSKFDNQIGLTINPDQIKEFREVQRKQDFIKKRRYHDDERRNIALFKALREKNIDEINNLMTQSCLPKKDSSSQCDTINFRPIKTNLSEKRENICPEEGNEFIEVTRKQNFIERKYSLDTERRNPAFFDESIEPNINNINNLIMKNDSLNKDSLAHYSKTNLKPDKCIQSEQKELINQKEGNEFREFQRKQDYIEKKYSICDRRRSTIFFNDAADCEINKINYLRKKDSSTQYSYTNLKSAEYVNEKTTLQVPTQLQTKTYNLFKEKRERLSSLPSYYAELIPKANKSRSSNLLAKLDRKESTVYNKLNTIQGDCKYSRSQHFSLDHQLRNMTFSETNCAKKNKDDHSERRISIVNHVEAKPFLIEQANPFSALRDNIHNKPLDNTFTELKPESKFINKSKFGAEEAMKYRETLCRETLQRKSSKCNNSFSNLLEEYQVQNNAAEQNGNAYYEAINFTEFLIKKLSQKNNSKEGPMKSQMNLCNSSCSCEEKCTQTFQAVPPKETKNLIYKEKVTQTMR